ncbi:bifunctional folylpolyglutamate synthase/dihydrofolate synthase [Roseospirillum parvum]|uniref:Dihydrofolate synthase/folylpolyglutamate synthase n=1 Tax=Roseospirillum parvum TaxID=83401 RepID=A0A1G8EIQ8_9PROT|nr:folylpolyglutamate synthase/dihydrofolate synthase family protein [Roseospirillum parvum]SDH69767.1 dihydrofolate synthase / folylpolyglutamate synthase [Roseospirillum parvum]
MPPSQASDPVLARLLDLHPKLIDLTLGRIETLLADLGDPHLKLPGAVVHVAGTNGKGSVIAFMRAMLEAAGLTVHVYTSPHLVRFAERIRVAGRIIGEAELTALLEEVEAANAGRPITFFEITTAAAFLAFSRVPADVVLLETGLGGRLDATNVVRRPALTLLTPVSMDHESYLGGRIESIAAEKAGILKPGVGVVVARQPRKAARVIELKSLEMGCPTWREGSEWFVRTRPAPQGGLVLETIAQDGARCAAPPLPLPALPGPHQLHNAGLALAALEHLKGVSVSPEARAEGLRAANWPGRLHRLTRGPLVESLPDGWELWLDGGHNPAAGQALAAQARLWRDRPLSLIVGMLKDKKADGFLRPLAPALRHLRAIPMPNPDHAGQPTAELVAHARAAQALDAAEAPDLAAALADIQRHAGPTPHRVLIAGSLYLAGHVLENHA